MKPGTFSYIVEVNITFTAREILALYDASGSHYDWKCKAAGRPRREGLSFGGEIWGLINRIPLGDPIIKGDQDDSYAKRACSANPDATVEVCLSTDTISTLCKISEMPGTDPEEDKVLWGLRIGLKQALHSANDEWKRLNPRTPDDDS